MPKFNKDDKVDARMGVEAMTDFAALRSLAASYVRRGYHERYEWPASELLEAVPELLARRDRLRTKLLDAHMGVWTNQREGKWTGEEFDREEQRYLAVLDTMEDR